MARRKFYAAMLALIIWLKGCKIK
ncbi:uncharacterized protein FTOL_00417 [Fusarium torulosum]|uniref:Uncharacterized protein n=1 Tax=Fusarium torulosum TaxID=33205 RepID=A0AAE8LY97_9HYPO|nr:uncharacterized protein FTOL_00417 [Fusarium torulosum]